MPQTIKSIVDMEVGSLEAMVDNLTYRSYAHNRSLSPEISPARWAKVYGATTEAMEARYQTENTRRCEAWIGLGATGENGFQCSANAVDGSGYCQEHLPEPIGRTASEYGNDEIRWLDGLQHY